MYLSKKCHIKKIFSMNNSIKERTKEFREVSFESHFTQRLTKFRNVITTLSKISSYTLFKNSC